MNINPNPDFQPRTEESIVAAVRKLGIIADLSSQPKTIGLLGETLQAGKRVYTKPIFRYESRTRII